MASLDVSLEAGQWPLCQTIHPPRISESSRAFATFSTDRRLSPSRTEYAKPHSIFDYCVSPCLKCAQKPVVAFPTAVVARRIKTRHQLGWRACCDSPTYRGEQEPMNNQGEQEAAQDYRQHDPGPLWLPSYEDRKDDQDEEKAWYHADDLQGRQISIAADEARPGREPYGGLDRVDALPDGRGRPEELARGHGHGSCRLSTED
ncbi:hypothetical protein CDD83_8441 [Cordyceps sp. RAO-2017]|nr:hypothetical protein CDD83_8441 [Cordyceps sp. RAO-2017]